MADSPSEQSGMLLLRGHKQGSSVPDQSRTYSLRAQRQGEAGCCPGDGDEVGCSLYLVLCSTEHSKTNMRHINNTDTTYQMMMF